MKKQVSASRAGDKIQALHDKIEDARVSGKSLVEAGQGGRPEGADRSPPSTLRAEIPKARRSICRTSPNCCAPPSLPTSGWTRRR